MAEWIAVLNSVLLVAILGAIAHTLIRVGEIQTKVNAMWEWWVHDDGNRK
jgi:hypothetical protein